MKPVTKVSFEKPSAAKLGSLETLRHATEGEGLTISGKMLDEIKKPLQLQKISAAQYHAWKQQAVL